MDGNNVSETKSRFQKWLRPALVVVATVIVVVIILVTPPWGVSPQSVIAKAYVVTIELQSCRVFSFTTYTYESKTVDITWEIEFAAPDRYHAKVTVDDDVNEVIIIGDRQYSREPRGGQVIVAAVTRSFYLKEETLNLLDQLTDLERLPDEIVQGIDCLHYQGSIDVARIVEKQRAKLDPEQLGYEQIVEDLERLRNAKTEVELWIGKDDYLIRQVKQHWEFPRSETISGSAEQEIWHTANIMWKYYDFNKLIEIEPPTTASGELLPGWQLVDISSAGSRSEELPVRPKAIPPPREAIVLVKSQFKGDRWSQSSGFITSAVGHILTFLDTAELEKLEVVLHDGRTLPAQVIDIDPVTDLACIKIEASGLTILRFGVGVRFEVGERLMAVGYSSEEFKTISAKVLDPDYTLSLPKDNIPVVKLDGSGEPGFAGGPVVNMAGEAVGINLAFDPKTGEAFMVPIDYDGVIQVMRSCGGAR